MRIPALGLFASGSLGLLCLFGCERAIEQQVAKSPNSILKKTTQDIGELNPADKPKISDSKVQITDPVTGPLQAYGPAMEQIAKLGIDQAVILFQAEEGRFPNSHEEFMTRIIKANNIRLPVLPGGAKYKYDVENHKLEVVKAE